MITLHNSQTVPEIALSTFKFKIYYGNGELEVDNNSMQT